MNDSAIKNRAGGRLPLFGREQQPARGAHKALHSRGARQLHSIKQRRQREQPQQSQTAERNGHSFCASSRDTHTQYFFLLIWANLPMFTKENNGGAQAGGGQRDARRAQPPETARAASGRELRRTHRVL